MDTLLDLCEHLRNTGGCRGAVGGLIADKHDAKADSKLGDEAISSL